MKEIFENQYYRGTRSVEQQRIVDLMTDHFPESGLPGIFGITRDYIIITSQLVNLYLGYKHRQYEEDIYNTHAICIYSRASLTLISSLRQKYPVNSILFHNDFLLAATGIYGQVGGQLLQYNFQQHVWRTCSNTHMALSFLTIQQGRVYVLATGYNETASELHELNNNAELYLHYNRNTHCTLIPNDDENDMPSEEMKTLLENREEHIIPTYTANDIIERLTTLINKGVPEEGYFYAEYHL